MPKKQKKIDIDKEIWNENSVYFLLQIGNRTLENSFNISGKHLDQFIIKHPDLLSHLKTIKPELNVSEYENSEITLVCNNRWTRHDSLNEFIAAWNTTSTEFAGE